MNTNRPVPLLDVPRGNAPMREEFLEALANVIDSGRFLFGPDVKNLEEECARWMLGKVDYCRCCGSLMPPGLICNKCNRTATVKRAPVVLIEGEKNTEIRRFAAVKKTDSFKALDKEAYSRLLIVAAKAADLI